FGDGLAVETFLLGLGHEFIDTPGRSVMDRDSVAFFGNVEGEVGTHHRQADQADIRSRHTSSPSEIFFNACAQRMAPNLTTNQPPTEVVFRDIWSNTGSCMEDFHPNLQPPCPSSNNG